MARVELENLLGVPLYRTLFTGTSYDLEPPETIPANATVFWQTNDTGSVTYDAPKSGERSRPFSATTAPPVPAIATPAIPGATMTADAADATTMVSEPIPVAAPPNPRQTERPFTLAWQFTQTSAPRFTSEQVAPGVKVDVRERFDGATYTVRPTRRRRLTPPPRRRMLVIGSVLLVGLIIATTVTAAASGTNPVDFVRHFFGQGPTSHPATLPHISLTASQTSVAQGSTVTLTATIDSAQPPAGYEIDIIDTGSNQLVPPSPCTGTNTCTASVTSNSASTATYQAFVERGAQNGVLVGSSTVTVTWLASNVPTSVTLSSDPPADATGSVKVTVGATVTLTATTDLAVDAAHYQIAIVDASGNQAGAPCQTGATCTATVTRSSQGTTTYTAYVEPAGQDSRQIGSSQLTVVWGPPAPPTGVSLTVDNANPGFGQSVTLTATASGAVDNTGYIIQIEQEQDNSVELQRCTNGTSCTVTVPGPSSATSVSFQAFIDQGDPTASAAQSNIITVIWPSPPPPPASVSLAWSTTNGSSGTTGLIYPANGQTITITATTDTPVDNTGYQIVITGVNTADNSTYATVTCQTGTTCQWQGFDANRTVNFTATVVSNNGATILQTSNTIQVHWVQPPA